MGSDKSDSKQLNIDFNAKCIYVNKSTYAFYHLFQEIT